MPPDYRQYSHRFNPKFNIWISVSFYFRPCSLDADAESLDKSRDLHGLPDLDRAEKNPSIEGLTLRKDNSLFFSLLSLLAILRFRFFFPFPRNASIIPIRGTTPAILIPIQQAIKAFFGGLLGAVFVAARLACFMFYLPEHFLPFDQLGRKLPHAQWG